MAAALGGWHTDRRAAVCAAAPRRAGRGMCPLPQASTWGADNAGFPCCACRMSAAASQAAADPEAPGGAQQAAAMDASPAAAAAAQGAGTGGSPDSQATPSTLSPHYDASREIVLRFESLDQQAVKVGARGQQCSAASQPAIQKQLYQ